MESGNAVSPATGTLEVIKPQFSASNSGAPAPSADTNDPIPISSQAHSAAGPSTVASAPDAVASDAVEISLTSATPSTNSRSADPLSQGNTSDSSAELTKEQAQQLAEQYQTSLNKTSVRFGVTVAKDNTEAISFQVIDKETGKVVRQFPADSSSAAKISDLAAKGALIDEAS